jgi:ribosome biogenesis GTPase
LPLPPPSPVINLEYYGWDAGWQKVCRHSSFKQDHVGRIVGEQRGVYQVMCRDGVQAAKAVGALRHLSRQGKAERLAVGDWVVLPPATTPRIAAILPRRSVIARKEAGRAQNEQVIGSNIDTAFIVCAPGELNVRKIERFVSIVSQGNVHPVVLLNKVDLVTDRQLAIDELQAALPNSTVCASSTYDATIGIKEVLGFLKPGKTIALVGSSGVGKTSLLNCLLDKESHATGALMADGVRGRHTTTARYIVLLPGGGLILDTPGLREVGMRGAPDGIDAAFGDIAALAAGCRFTNCSHSKEPQCAVQLALQTEKLTQERFAAWQSLHREVQGQCASAAPQPRTSGKHSRHLPR